MSRRRRVQAAGTFRDKAVYTGGKRFQRQKECAGGLIRRRKRRASRGSPPAPTEAQDISAQLRQIGDFWHNRELTEREFEQWLKQRLRGRKVSRDDWTWMMTRYGKDEEVTTRVVSIVNRIYQRAASRRGGAIPDFRSPGSGQTPKYR